jgi:hypothetical protein
MRARLERLQHLRLARSSTEVVTALAILLGAIYLVHLTFYFQHVTQAGYAGGRLFPQIALGVLILCAGKLLLEHLVRRRQRPAPDSAIDLDAGGLVPVVAVTIAYALLLERIGFELSTFALMLALLGPRIKLVHALWASALTSLVVYAVFALMLQVDLPLRFLPAMLPL